MGNWFGNLDLAYKYTLKKLAAKQNEDTIIKEERTELNEREKDEGDLFGIRALEAGFYAGIAQSRPTSRAGSITGTPNMSTSTLVGGISSPKIQTHSMNNSVATLPLAHTKERNHSPFRDSDTLPSLGSEPRRKTPPTIRLAPSEAELSGRINHNAAINVSLNVPRSPVTNRAPPSPTFGGSDSGESDGRLSPRSPRSPSFTKPEHYAPNPPQLTLPEGFRASFVSIHEQYMSQAGSLIIASPSHSVTASPTLSPEVRVPSMPGITLNDAELNSTPPLSPVLLLPRTYQPSHQRDDSDSSIYSDRRRSTNEPEVTLEPNRKSVAVVTSKGDNRRTLLAPVALSGNRYSDIYDAYYRHSMLNPSSSTRSDESHTADAPLPS
ncbi:hypothetical protein N0V90_007717 [Kalmusia sp. IMI 367209]|nr:hypothetical protein N0V90_007717 [Kalmusia sp. IMI 367209]